MYKDGTSTRIVSEKGIRYEDEYVNVFEPESASVPVISSIDIVFPALNPEGSGGEDEVVIIK
jgi:hypothetical protein